MSVENPANSLVRERLDGARSILLFSALQLKKEFEEIYSTGNKTIETTLWGAVLDYDLQIYLKETCDPDASREQLESFSEGIKRGYAFMIGVFMQPEVDKDYQPIVGEEDLALFREVIDGRFSSSSDLLEESDLGGVDDSRELFFSLLAEKLAEDPNFNRLISSYEELLVEKLSDKGDLAEYEISGFLHGISSVYGLERLRYEKIEHDRRYGVDRGIEDMSRYLDEQ